MKNDSSKRNRFKKKHIIKLIKYVSIYAVLMFILLDFMISAVVEKVDIDSIETVTGEVQSLEIDRNGAKNYVNLIFKINNTTYVLVWSSSKSYVDAVEAMKKEDTLTIKYYENVTWKSNGFNQIVDVRSDTRVYYDFEYDQKYDKFATIGIIIVFSIFIIIVTIFFLLFVLTIIYA